MKAKITFSEPIFEKCTDVLTWDGREKAAWLLCHTSASKDSIKLLPHKILIPDKCDYVKRSVGYYELKKDFITKAMRQAVAEQSHIIQCHIHPQGCDTFSQVDEHHELMLMRHINEKVEGMHHASIVFSNSMEVLDSWIYDTQNDQLVRIEKVIVVGKNKLEVYVPTGRRDYDRELSETLNRTVMALGKPTVAKIGRLDFGVAGASGLGGFIIEFLARDKVGSITICDTDVIDDTNLNRLPWATETDIGRLKAEFYAEVVHKISPKVKVCTYKESLYEPHVQEAFSQTDLIIGCLDSGARLSVNRLACANLIPYFDLGAGIEFKDDKTTFIGGQVFCVIPGSSICLSCSGAFEIFRDEYIPEKDRQREIRQGYIQGTDDKTVPLIMSLDSVISGMGYNQMLKYISGICSEIPFRVHYSDIDHQTIASECHDDGCMTCTVKGFVGKGNKVPLMVPRKNIINPLYFDSFKEIAS